MPREDRRIVFSVDEVYKAVYMLAVQKQMPKPPPGAITSIIMTEDATHKIILHLENPAQNTKDTVEYSNDFVAAALMLFCRGQGIPLPKRANKTVMLTDGELVLRAQI